MDGPLFDGGIRYHWLNSSRTWNLHITGPAQKEFQKLPPKEQARVKDALLAMQQDPFRGDIKRLKGQAAAWRRVGNYRILYDLHVEEHRIVVAGILRRTSTTY